MRPKFLGRMLWKETVELSPVFIAAAIGTVLLQAFVAYLCVNNLMGTRIDLYWLKFVGIVVSLIFGGAVSASMFNREQDQETLEFLQSLPMNAGEFYFGKVLPVVSWGILLFVFGLLSASTVVRFFGEETSLFAGMGRQGFVLSVIWGGLVVVLGATCSLTVKSVYTSIAITTLVAMVLGIVASNTNLATVAVCAMGVPFFLVGLHKKLAQRCLYLSSDVPLFTRTRIAPNDSPGLRRRLVWQQLVHVGRTAIIALFAAIAFVVFLLDAHPVAGLSGAGIIASALATYLGAQTFAVDQREQGYRFFADRGASPTTLWLVRVCVMATVVAVVVLPLVIVAFAQFDGLVTIGLDSFGLTSLNLLAGSVLLLPFLSFSVGQFFSQRLASPVLNLFCSFATIVPLVGWVWLASVLGIPAAFYGLPLLAALLFATWLYMPNWLVGKRTLRHGWLTLAIPAIATLVCYFGASLYRVYEIPKATLPEISTLKPTSGLPESSQRRAVGPERDAAIWTELIEAQASPGRTDLEVEWLTSKTPPFVRIRTALHYDHREEDEQVLAEIMDAENTFQFPYPAEVVWRKRSGDRLARFLLQNARRREAVGDVDEAWKIYVRLFDVLDAMRHRATKARWWSAISHEISAYGYLQTWALQANREQLQMAIDFLKPRMEMEEALKQLVFDTRYVNQQHIRDETIRLASQSYGYNGLAADKILAFEQQRLERLVDRIAELDLLSLNGFIGSTRTVHWERPADEVNAQLFSSPTDVMGPLDLYQHTESLYQHRKASVVHMTFLSELMGASGKPIHEVWQNVHERLALTSEVKFVPSQFGYHTRASDREAAESAPEWVRLREWRESGPAPITWPRLIFTSKHGIAPIRAPIPTWYELRSDAVPATDSGK